MTAKHSEEEAQMERTHKRTKNMYVCVWTAVMTCVCVCVTLAWPVGKVGRQESQCESSQAFSPRLAGFITATNHWPDKSSYFILPSFTSSCSLFSSLFYFPKTALSLLSPDSAVALPASPCTLPGSLTVFPHSVTALFSISSLFFIVFPSSKPLCPYLYTPFSYPPRLHLLFHSSLYLSPPSL